MIVGRWYVQLVALVFAIMHLYNLFNSILCLSISFLKYFSLTWRR